MRHGFGQVQDWLPTADPRQMQVADPKRFVRETLGPASAEAMIERMEAAREFVREAPSGLPVDREPSARCVCLVEAAATHAAELGTPLTTEDLELFAAQCEADPDRMEAILKEAGADIEACKPWYKRKRTWLIGGLAVGGGLLLWAVTRKRK